MALTNITTDIIDLSSDTTALKMPKGTTSERIPIPISLEYLVVAGGGGAGGGESAGGGGAGGLRTGTTTISGGTMAIQVGEGGASQSSQTTRGNSGTNSSLALPSGTISATGGGGGGSRNSGTDDAPITSGASGGSGGGTALDGALGGAGNAGGYNPVEGYIGGGSGAATGYEFGNGGGGAGQAGATSTNPGYYILGAQGGNGVSSSIINATLQSSYNIGENVSGDIYFAGGGAGGGYASQQDLTRIESGDGNGGKAGYYNSTTGVNVAAVAVLPNTGGGGNAGGGGAGTVWPGLAGSDGVIILKTTGIVSATFSAGCTVNGTSGAQTTNGDTSTGNSIFIITVAGASDDVTFPTGNSPTEGLLRENTTTGKMEVYTGTLGWRALLQTDQDVGLVPSDNFNVEAYIGNAGTKSITGLNFQPDLVWTKSSTQAYNHMLYDSARGVGTYLEPNGTAYSQANANTLISFDTNGFVLGASDNSNYTNGGEGVSWSWKAGGVVSPNNNSVGTITATVSTNQDAGFSIVKYTGSSTLSDTIGTGFTSQADLIIVKKFGSGYGSWAIWSSTFSDASETLFLDINSSSSTYIDRFGTVSATTFQAGSTGGSEVNASGIEMIAYCWQSVPGYSLISSYIGTGSATETPIIYTGFEPAWLMVKRTDSTGAWNINDNKRNTSNPRNSILQANVADREYTNNAYNINFYNDGFQINNNHGDWNAAGGKYLFMCFAS